MVVGDNGYYWLTIMPSKEFYCITVMIDDNVSYSYDLYLDLVLYPNGDSIVDDMDELQEALKKGDISEMQYNRELETSQKLQDGLLSDIGKFQDYVSKTFNMLP